MPAVLVARFDIALPISGFGYGGASRTGARGRAAPDFFSPSGRFPVLSAKRRSHPPIHRTKSHDGFTEAGIEMRDGRPMRVSLRVMSCGRIERANRGVMKERRRDSHIRASVCAPGGVVSSAAPRDNPNHILGVIAL